MIDDTPTRHRIIAIVGPTAAGKSRLALELAARFQGEIVNADSRLFYRGVDIGTDKPGREALARAPHHLVDCLEAHETMGLAEFLSAATRAVEDTSRRGKVPFVVGGTGQYVWGLIEAWDVPRVPPDPELRAELEREADARGHLSVYQKLQALDPAAAGRIDPRNVRRVIRAIEVARAGDSVARAEKSNEARYHYLMLGIDADRDALYERIDKRIEDMIERGWVEEVRQLLDSGVSRTAPAMGAIGYPELAAHVQGEITLDEAIQRTKRATRKLVRHQYGWFRRSDPRIQWLDRSPSFVATLDQASRLVEDWLAEGDPRG